MNGAGRNVRGGLPRRGQPAIWSLFIVLVALIGAAPASGADSPSVVPLATEGNVASFTVGRGHSVIVDGVNASTTLEWADSTVLRFPGPAGVLTVMAKQVGPVLLVAAEVGDNTNFGTDRVDVLVDASEDGGAAPLVDDRWIWIQRDGSKGALKGNGAGWIADTALAWQYGRGVVGGGWFAEFSVPLMQLGIVPGATASFGIEFRIVDENGVTTDEYFWSPSGSGTDPSTWGQVTSATLWTGYPGAPFWTLVSDLDDPDQPPRRFSSSTAYDEGNDTMVLFGGDNGVNPPTNDTWLLRNATGAAGPQEWSLLIPDGAAGSPGPDFEGSAVYDPATDRMTLFGGYYSGNGVWVLINATGRLGAPEWVSTLAGGLPGTPAARWSHSAVYDQASNKMVVFGGYETGYGVRNDVWALRRANGLGGPSSWINLVAEGSPGSPRRASHSAVYDPTTNKMVVFGGFLAINVYSDTWVLENATGLPVAPVWKNTIVQGTLGSPKNRFAHVAGLDPVTGSMVIFSGADSTFCYSDTWTLAYSTTDTPQWTQSIADADPLSPPCRDRAMSAYHPSTDRLFVFGGYNPSGIVKALNDSWSLQNATALPPGPPTSLTATAGNQSVNLSWTAPVRSAEDAPTGYRIYRSTTSGSEFLIATIGPQTSYTDPGLANGVTYYYRVAALDDAGEGPAAAETSATPVQVPLVPGAFALLALVLCFLALFRLRRR